MAVSESDTPASSAPVFTSATTPTTSRGLRGHHRQRHVLADRILSRPEPLRGPLADDDDARPAERVGLGEVAALQDRDPGRPEVARRRQPDRDHRQFRRLHRRRAFGGDVLRRAALQWQRVDPCGRFHARERPDALERPIEELVQLLGCAITAAREARWWPSARCARRTRDPPPRRPLRLRISSPAPIKQHQRQRHFGHDQQVAHASVAPPRNCRGSSPA